MRLDTYALRAARGPRGGSDYNYNLKPELLDMDVARCKIEELAKNARIIAEIGGIFSLMCVPFFCV
jgi:hypothetical protein